MPQVEGKGAWVLIMILHELLKMLEIQYITHVHKYMYNIISETTAQNRVEGVTTKGQYCFGKSKCTIQYYIMN